MAAFCFCVIAIGRGSLASWDEAYYALVSREIFRTGDWVHLRFFNAPFYDKPPLYMWLSALFYKVFGVGELGSRLPSGLAGIGVILGTYCVGRKLLGRAAALAGAGLLLSSTDFLHYARWGTLDILNLFFFTWAVFFYLSAKDRPVYWVFFWLASAGAIMTKGLLIGLVWLLVFCDAALRKESLFFRNKYFWWGIILMVAAVLPWHWAVYQADPQAFMRDIVQKHYFSRTSQAVEGHTGNYYFYIRTLINKYHPWISLAPAALPWAIWRSRGSSDRYAFRFLIAWVILILSVFTFVVKTKLQWYILPLHPALSLLLGAFLAAFIFKTRIMLLKIMIASALLLNIPFSSVLIQDYVPALKSLSVDVKSLSADDETVYLYNYHDQPAAIFYFDRPVSYADSLETLDRISADRERTVLIVEKTQFDTLKPALDERRFRIVRETSGYKTDLLLMVKG